MRRVAIFLGAMLVASIFLPSRLAPPVAASATAYSFNLIRPNTAENSLGRTIRVTGSGNFDSGASSVVASGSFTTFFANGARIHSGTWQATAFTSFHPFGGPNPGTQGGFLKITVTLFPDGAVPITGLPMTVTCRVNAPAGFTEEEGTTVADFRDKPAEILSSTWITRRDAKSERIPSLRKTRARNDNDFAEAATHRSGSLGEGVPAPRRP